MDLELDEIRKIIELMKENDISVFEFEKEGWRISLKKGGEYVAVPPPIAAAPPVLSAQQQAAAAAAQPAAEQAPGPDLREIKAPFVGTFYRAPSPDAEPYVQVGQEVGSDTVLCIIEAMKVMNEIKAEMHGRVKEILVENGQPVQYGQPIFRIEAH